MEDQEMQSLTDGQLSERLLRMASSERRITAQMLRHLAEFDRRGLYKKRYGTLWNYCASALKFSPAEIKLRIQAARAIRDNTKLLGLLESGETTVAAIGRLAPHLKEERAEQLIEQVRGKSRREVEWIVATEAAASRPEASPQPGFFELPGPDEATIRRELRDRRDKIVPLDGEEAEIRFMASRQFVEKLERAQTILARSYPDGALREVIGEAIELLLEKKDPMRRSARRQARAERKPQRTRGIPLALRDEVLRRDGYRCVVLEPDGSRCAEKRWLEIDHVKPSALGGETTLENLRACCRRHNYAAAIAVFGERHVASAIARQKAQ